MWQCELNYLLPPPLPPPPLPWKRVKIVWWRGQVVWVCSFMFWLKNKQRGSLTPSFPLLTFFFVSSQDSVLYLLCFMHWVTIDIDKNSITFCFPHSRNWAWKGGGGGWEQSKKVTDSPIRKGGPRGGGKWVYYDYNSLKNKRQNCLFYIQYQ